MPLGACTLSSRTPPVSLCSMIGQGIKKGGALMSCEGCTTQEDVLRLVREKDVSFIQFWFTDVLGVLKTFAITQSELETGMSEGMGFDGSSIEGFARIHESDMVAMPDPTTFQMLPWRSGERPVARMFCDIVNPDHTPYEGDPRYVLKRLLKKIGDKGYTFYVGPELEYFYFKSNKEPEGLDTQELDLRYRNGFSMSDKTVTNRAAVKESARQHRRSRTSLPKPIFGENGSGMHVHQSLFAGDKNLFFDGNDPYHLSKMAKGYIAGIMKHAREIIAVTNQWVNSYKRLVPGYEAPVYISWARRNRSAMIRVPMYKPGKEVATRIEFRAPDPACNPYLAFAVMLAAGLKGVENQYELPDPIEEDIYEMSEKDKNKKGIITLPGNLYEAILEVEKSELVKDALGEHVFKKFVENKKIEWDMYRTHVSQYEIEKYMPIT